MTKIYQSSYASYIEAGYSVIPDRPTSHAPYIAGWAQYCDRLPTLEEASAFIASDIDSNISLCLGAASGVIALDLDATDPTVLDLVVPILPPSPVEKVGSKGWTRFFKYNGEHSQQIKYNGEVVIEILSTSKKTTIPNSIHPKTGEPYKWQGLGLLDVSKADLPFLPPFLLAHIQDKLRFTQHLEMTPSTIVQKQVVNGRTIELSRLTMQLIEERVDVQSALKKLIEFDMQTNAVPKFSDLQDQRQPDPLTNALKFYSDHLLSFNSRQYKEGKLPIVPFVALTPPKLANPERDEKAPPRPTIGYNLRPLPAATGLLGDVQNYILRNSFVKQPALAFSASLLLLSTLVSRKLVFQGVSPNLYALNIASSGAGKDAPQQMIKRILTAMGAEHYLGSGDYVSDASLMDSLTTKPVRLDLIDEASGLLGAALKGENGYDGKMADIWCELYTSSNDKFLGRTTAEGTKGECYRPNVCLLASTTPRGLEESVSLRSIDKGLLGRFLLFFGEHHQPSQRIRSMEHVPIDIVSRLQYWASYKAETTHQFATVVQEWTEVGATEEGEKLLERYFKEIDGMRCGTEIDNPLLPIISRLYPMMLKISLVHACSRMEGDSVVVDIADIEFAHETVMHYFENMKYMLSMYIYENWQEAKLIKIFRTIRQNDNGIPSKELAKKTKFVSRKERLQLIEDLIENGQIEVLQGDGDLIFKAKE